MIAICNGVNITDLLAYGYSAEQIPQYGQTMEAIDGTDYSAKLRDRWHIVAPFLPLTQEQLRSVLALFPPTSAYVSWTFDDTQTGTRRTRSFKYGVRKADLKVRYRNGIELWSGLSVDLTER